MCYGRLRIFAVRPRSVFVLTRIVPRYLFWIFVIARTPAARANTVCLRNDLRFHRLAAR
jgi:hypothetical protein